MKPYVKKYDEKGILINPVGTIKNEGPNRRQRKSIGRKVRFKGNHKGVSLTVLRTIPPIKYKRVLQFVHGKRIEHYIKA